MALNQLSTDVEVIAQLGDEPNTDDGLTPAQLKAKFDFGSKTIKSHINTEVTDALNSDTDGDSGADNIGMTQLANYGSATTTVQANVEALDAQVKTNRDDIDTNTSDIASLVAGTIPDGSVTNAKLATDVKVGSIATLTTTEKSSVVGAINEVDSNVSDIEDGTTKVYAQHLTGSGSIPTTGWSASATDYAYELDITISGVLATDFVEIFLDKDSQDIASDINLSPSVDEATDTITIYADKVPTSTLSYKYRVVR